MAATVTPLPLPRTDPDAPADSDIAAMAAALTAEGWTPERVLAGRDTPLSRAVAARMRDVT